jgi:hypothetical protein
MRCFVCFGGPRLHHVRVEPNRHHPCRKIRFYVFSNQPASQPRTNQPTNPWRKNHTPLKKKCEEKIVILRDKQTTVYKWLDCRSRAAQQQQQRAAAHTQFGTREIPRAHG